MSWPRFEPDALINISRSIILLKIVYYTFYEKINILKDVISVFRYFSLPMSVPNRANESCKKCTLVRSQVKFLMPVTSVSEIARIVHCYIIFS